MNSEVNVLLALPTQFGENVKQVVVNSLKNTGYYSDVNATCVGKINDFLTESYKAKYNYIIMFFALDDAALEFNEVMDTVQSTFQRKVVYVVEDKMQGSPLLRRLYEANFYNALYMSDCSGECIAEMFQSERNEAAAASYYGLNYISNRQDDFAEEEEEKPVSWAKYIAVGGGLAAAALLLLLCVALIPGSFSKNSYETEVVAHDSIGDYSDSENRVEADSIKRAEGEEDYLLASEKSNNTESSTDTVTTSEYVSNTLTEHTGKDTITTITRVVAGQDGKDGEDGKDGVNGRNGVDGKDGLNGTNGVNGKDGANGTNGKDGVNGVDGKNGKNGVDGEDGADGKDGLNGKDGKDGVDGKDGKDGVNGQDGKDGADGKDGTDGKDAYEIAVELGFNGTREEWLASMSGALSDFSVVCDNNVVYFYKEVK